MLDAIADRRVREKLASTIDSLESDPELRKPPADPRGYRSGAPGQRYRIIYRVERSEVVVVGGAWNPQGRSREDVTRWRPNRTLWSAVMDERPCIARNFLTARPSGRATTIW
jgi:plasmid stabilization system protein ParE